MARLLAADGQDLSLLALIDAYAPGAFTRRSTPRRLLAHARMIWGLKGERRKSYLRKRVEQFWRRVRPRAGSSEAPGAAGPDGGRVADAIARVTEANARAWQRYRPGPYAGRAVLFRGAEVELATDAFSTLDAFNGWRPLVEGGLEVVNLPCQHLRLFEGEALDTLAKELRSRLDDAARPAASAARS